jgi:hypothetical protein
MEAPDRAGRLIANVSTSANLIELPDRDSNVANAR